MSAKIGEVQKDPDLIRQGLAGELEKIRDGFATRTLDGDPLSVFENLRTARQQVGELSGWAKASRDLPPLAQRNAVAIARDAYSGIRGTLTDEATWGPAATRQAALDEAHSNYSSALKVLQGGKLSPLNSNLLRNVVDRGQEELQLNPRALRTFLNQMGDPRSDRITEALGDFLKSADDYAQQMEESFKAIPTSEFDRPALSNLVGKTQSLVQQADEQASITRMLHDLSPDAGFSSGGAKALLPTAGNEGTLGGLGMVALSPIVGHAIPGAGPVMAAYGAGKAVYGAVKGLKNIPQTIATLVSIERTMQRVSSAIDTAASTLVRGGVRAESVGRAESLAGIAREFSGTAEDATRRFSKRVADIQKLSQDPESLHRSLVAQNQDLDEHAPNTSQALSITSARAVAFLTGGNSRISASPCRGGASLEKGPAGRR